jgi:hypothetical protein
MRNRFFYNELKKIPTTTEPLSLLKLHEIVLINKMIKKNIDSSNLHLIFSTFKYFIFDRKPVNDQMKWELKLAKTLFTAYYLDIHLRNYFGVDITDEEMAQSPFAKKK